MDTSDPKQNPTPDEPDKGRTEPPQNPPEIDKMKLQMLMQQIRDNQNLSLGILGGAVAAVVGAAVWAAVTVVSEQQIGFLAIGVGYLVGWTVRKLGQGVDKAFGVVGAVMALVGCVLGNYLSAIGFIAAEYGAGYFEVLNSFNFDDAIEIMAASFSPMDILFYALALYFGYKTSFRGLSEEELQTVVKR